MDLYYSLVMKKLLVFLVLSILLHAGEKEYLFLGKHFIANYSECDPEALKNAHRLVEVMREGVNESGAQILNESSYFFPGDGLTMAILLSESHASIHTYPEHNACFVDLFTCGDHCHYEPFDRVLREYLKPRSVQSKVLIRDEAFIEHHH